jgi:hypothetical protein
MNAGIPDSKVAELLDNPTRILNSLQQTNGAISSDGMRQIVTAAYRRGFRIIFLTGTGLSAVAFILAFILMPQVELRRTDEVKLKEEGKIFDQKLRQGKKGLNNSAREEVETSAHGVKETVNV